MRKKAEIQKKVGEKHCITWVSNPQIPVWESGTKKTEFKT